MPSSWLHYVIFKTISLNKFIGYDFLPLYLLWVTAKAMLLRLEGLILTPGLICFSDFNPCFATTAYRKARLREPCSPLPDP